MVLPNYFISGDLEEYEDLILKYGTKKKIAKKTILYGATSPNHLSYYIVSGIAKLSIVNETGKEVILCFFSKGSAYPVNCMSDSFNYEDCMELSAVTDLEIIEYESDRIMDMIEENVSLARAVINRYSKYCIILISKILMASYNNSMQLVCSFLYLFSLESKENTSVIKLTQDDIAKITGISLSHATRAITRLKAEGIIETHRGRIEILDYEGLKDYCGGSISEQ